MFMHSTEEKNIYYKASDLYKSKNFGEAFKLYLELAKMGKTDCQTFVGWMFFKGEGVEVNMEKALYWMRLAAKANDLEATFSLGKIYLKQKNYKRASDCFSKAAQSEYSPAIFNLARMYNRGNYFDIDKDLAANLFKLAISKGHLISRRDYALMKISGYEGFIGRFSGLYEFFYGFFLAIKVT